MSTTQLRLKDPQLATWFDGINEVSDRIRELTTGLSTAQLQWRPAPGKWSIAECLEHLAITARRGMEHWVTAVAAGRARDQAGSGPFSFGWLGGWFVGAVGPKPKRPMPAPAVFAPSASVDQARAIADFGGSQAEVLAIITSADGLDLGRIKARSSVTPLIRLNMAAWFASTVAHELRHVDQIRRVRNDASFPKI